MVFSSVIFLFFFLPLFLMVYFSIRKELRNLTLLVASLVFYFWGEGRYVIVMILYMVFNWFFGLIIEKYKKQEAVGWAKFVFILSLVFNLGFLVFFKYFSFLVDNLNHLIVFSGKQFLVPNIHLPIGISFFTFQALSYVIDVYRGDVKAQKSIIGFSMYKALFPQLIAGPIVRYRDVAYQIDSRQVTFRHFAEGIERFIVGLAKKVLIANNVALLADQVFQMNGQVLTAPSAWLGVVCYALQIYFDFSGYSDMAIGLGKMLGFDFLENFNYPYISKSIKEFWRRWHISLSSWFRDYLYISLGGNRKGKWHTYINLFAVFFLCGLWHGASWTFVIWGAWHGLFLVFERMRFGRLVDALPRVLRHGYTLIIVLIGWVFFRADNLTAAIAFLKAMAGASGTGTEQLLPLLNLKLGLALLLGFVFSTPVYTRLRNACDNLSFASTKGKLTVTSLYRAGFTTFLFVLFILCTVILSTNTYNPFIYFRF
ncbi:MAG: MBOAT family O-acyltransferase [Bacteroidota bacterium]|nr:MBOAT family O-acyltransferase [Bacteroidota bacterium]